MPNSANDNKKQALPRRRLLKALTATGGVVATGALVPRDWIAPVVQSVALPAHAQTSELDVPTGDFGAAVAVVGNNETPSILDLVVPAAYAGGSALVGGVSFDLFYSVGSTSAQICGMASHPNASTVLIGSTLGRTGNDLENHDVPLGGVTLSLFDQTVSESGVSLTASANKDSSPLFAPPGTGCGDILNVSSRIDSSSPYPDDGELA